MINVVELLKHRNSVRDYSGDHLSDADYETIIGAMESSPRGGNLQQFKVLAVTTANDKSALAKVLRSAEQIENCALALVFVVDLKTTSNWFVSEGEIYPFNNSVGYHFALIDAVCAAQNASIVAESLGFGSCYSGLPLLHVDVLSEYLSCSKGELPFLILTIGKAKTKSAPRFNFPAASFVKKSREELANIDYADVYVKSGKAKADIEWYFRDRQTFVAAKARGVTTLAQIYARVKYLPAAISNAAKCLNLRLPW